ncbi:hypothetical protein G9A89_012322 [Geosiphon pyriformis]|nr:hypothetical protein G9A89_012322 [Geosiphon pyriformis]
MGADQTEITFSAMQISCQEYLKALGCFDYNAANKIASKISKISAVIGSLLTTLAKCELTYTSLEFLKSKFLRKDDFLDILYLEALKEIQNIVKTLTSSPNMIDQDSIDHFINFSHGLQEFIPIRRAQIHIYRSLPTAFSDLANHSVREAWAFGHWCRVGISSFERELSMLRNLLIAHTAIVNYNFKDTTINMYAAKIELREWRKICSHQEYSEKSADKPEETTRGLFWHSFFSSGLEKNSKGGRRDQSLNNMEWLRKYHCNLTAKMTLYFTSALLEREMTMNGDFKNLWRKIDAENYYELIRNFKKKSGAHSIALIYEVTDDIQFQPHGYICNDVHYEKPTGINSFPCIYSYPKEQPLEHWPNIISIMQGQDPIKCTPFHRSTPIYFCDKGVGSTYYMIRVDAHVGLVIIYTEKHTHSDAATSEFIMSMANRLSGVEVLQNLQKLTD